MPKRKKYRYAVDDLNRLLIRKDVSDHPIEGEFKIKKNNLIYEPYAYSSLRKELDLPRKIEFQGNWQLDDNRDLELSLAENKHQFKEDILKIRGRLISCQPDTIIFETRCKKTLHKDKIYLLRLTGRWQADESNELIFLVTKDKACDTLKLQGGWQINKNHEIIYTYEKQDLIRKTKTQESVVFKGFWQVNTKERIVYMLDLDKNSFFDFKIQMEQPYIKGDNRKIKYRIGMGVRQLKREKIFTLFGRWRVDSQKNLRFEIDYGKRGVRALVFGADIYLTKNKELVFELNNRQGKKLGIKVVFSMNFLKKKASFFTKLFCNKDITNIDAGISVPW